MKYKNTILLLIGLNFLYSYTGSSYRYGYSARSFSLSSAMVADDYQTFQSFSNPSSLNRCDGTNYGISYFNMSLNRSIQTFYFSTALPGNAGLSMAILRSGVSDFMGKDEFNNPTKNISMSDYYGLLSFGLKGIGLSIKMHYSNLNINQEHKDKYTGNSIVVDLGWSSFVTPKLRIGLKAENIINASLNWEIDIPDDGYSNNYTENYPVILSLGSMYNLNDQHKFLLQYDKIQINNADIFLSRIGYEFNLSKKYFIRLGLKGSDDFKIGFGYIFNQDNSTFEIAPLVIDYSLDLGLKNEGVSHLFTWSFSL